MSTKSHLAEERKALVIKLHKLELKNNSIEHLTNTIGRMVYLVSSRRILYSTTDWVTRSDGKSEMTPKAIWTHIR